MSMAHLGPSFDIHTGGIDLIFPHHEDEIAQSEAATGQPFVRTWLHCAHLQTSGEKMAKSTGNIASVSRAARGRRLAAGAALRADRRALPGAASTTPRSRWPPPRPPLTPRCARRRAARLPRGRARTTRRCRGVLATRGTAFGAALDDDLNMSEALAALFDCVRDLNRRIEARSLSTADAERALALLRDLDGVLGVLPDATRISRRAGATARCAGRGPGGPRLGRIGSTARRTARRAASPSRTPATASAGGGTRRSDVADRPATTGPSARQRMAARRAAPATGPRRDGRPK